MAEVVDYVEPEGEFDQVTDVEPKQETFAEETKPEVDDDIPEIIRGKSIKDIAKLVINQKEMIDRQSLEVGEVRKLADELIKSQLKPAKAEVEQPQEVDFFENPQEAIRRAVENNPKVIAAEQMGIQSRMAQAKQMLVEKHPDFGNIVQDGEFVQWVKSSPIRTQLYNMAENYDVNAADELLSTFKQLKGIKPETVKQIDKEEVESRKKTLKAASVDTGGTGESSKKVYRRADLIRLRMSDPSRYDALSDEITRAYQEGRVK